METTLTSDTSDTPSHKGQYSPPNTSPIVKMHYLGVPTEFTFNLKNNIVVCIS